MNTHQFTEAAPVFHLWVEYEEWVDATCGDDFEPEEVNLECPACGRLYHAGCNQENPR